MCSYDPQLHAAFLCTQVSMEVAPEEWRVPGCHFQAYREAVQPDGRDLLTLPLQVSSLPAPHPCSDSWQLCHLDFSELYNLPCTRGMEGHVIWEMDHRIYRAPII